MTDTGKLIRACRKRRGMSVKEVADRWDRSPGSVRNVESQRGCTFDTLETIMEAMGYELDIFPIEGWQK